MTSDPGTLRAQGSGDPRKPISTPARFPRIPGTSVEIVTPPPVGRIRHAMIDFDGTISYLRDGWQDFMVPMMVDVLAACPQRDSREAIEKDVIHFVDHLTGKQTIYQMIRLVEEVGKRGGKPREAVEYKQEYHRRLSEHVRGRIEDLRAGRKSPDEFLVAGSKTLLEELCKLGVRCYVASGTDIEFVQEEVDLLGLRSYFEDRVFGALPNYKEYSKEIVIRRILTEEGLSGPELLVIGDGYVEIQNGRDVNAVTWGIYTSERNRYHMNDNKRGRLFRAGAHLLSQDLTDSAAVLKHLKVPTA
jgi:phosphoglycolate phosphatase-like HAD superfamily hydrolase